MLVYARSLPGCYFTVICLGLLLVCSSLIYMYIIWFMCSTLNDIIMICKVFVSISLYKKVKMQLIITKKRPNAIFRVSSIEKLIEKRWNAEKYFSLHISVCLRKIWLLKIFDQYLSLLICHFIIVADKIHCNTELRTTKIIKWMYLIHTSSISKMSSQVSNPLKMEITVLKQIWI